MYITSTYTPRSVSIFSAISGGHSQATILRHVQNIHPTNDWLPLTTRLFAQARFQFLVSLRVNLSTKRKNIIDKVARQSQNLHSFPLVSSQVAITLLLHYSLLQIERKRKNNSISSCCFGFITHHSLNHSTHCDKHYKHRSNMHFSAKDVNYSIRFDHAYWKVAAADFS